MSAAWRLLTHLVLFEVAIWIGLWRWVRRRPDVPAGATTIAYGALASPMLWLFIWGSVVEVVALEAILSHFGVTILVRAPLLVLGVWSVLWMLGLLASMRTRPHVLSEVELRLRSGLRGEVVVPRAGVRAVTTKEHELSGPLKGVEVVDDLLLVGVSGRTNVLLTFEVPTRLTTAKGDVTVGGVGFWTDEPRTAAGLVRAATGA